MINFGGLQDHCDFSKSLFVILPVPFDRTASYISGSRRGPLAIVEASQHMELWDEELENNPYLQGIHTLPQLEVTSNNPEVMIEAVRQGVKPLVKAGKVPIILGGEHSVSLGAVAALKEEHPELAVVQLDAHADLRDEFEGTAYSHACVMRRLFDLKVPFFQIGIRSLSEEEASFIKEKGLSPFWMHSLPPAETIMKKISHALNCPLYITLDVDVLDSGIMPASGTPEPGGLDYLGLLKILRGLFSEFRVVGFDLVELAPIPGFAAPDFLAARLAYKMIGYSSLSKK